MPFRYTIDHDDRFVSVQLDGEFGLADILAYFEALIAEGAMPYPKLVDGRQADARLSDDDWVALGNRVSANAAHDPRGPIAAVGGAGSSQDFLQRFRKLTGARRAFEIFATVEGARAWLGTLSARTPGTS